MHTHVVCSRHGHSPPGMFESSKESQKQKRETWTVEEKRGQRSRICLLSWCPEGFHQSQFLQSLDTSCLKVDSSSSFPGLNLTNRGREGPEILLLLPRGKKLCSAVFFLPDRQCLILLDHGITPRAMFYWSNIPQCETYCDTFSSVVGPSPDTVLPIS